LAAGQNASSKKRKAQALIAAGADLELIPEDDFLKLVYSTPTRARGYRVKLN
jgi:hypothetical protein